MGSTSLLLLTHEGTIWLADTNNLTRTSISAPSNGFEQYVEVAGSKYPDYDHNFAWLRYNDILYYSQLDQNHLFISFTEWRKEGECYVTTVAQLNLPAAFQSVLELSASEADWRIVYRTQPCLPLKAQFRAIEGHMAGSRLASYGDSHVILSSGDYGWDGFYAPEVLAQKDDADYGKILDIDELLSKVVFRRLIQAAV